MAYETILINADSEDRFPGVLSVTTGIAATNHSHVLAVAALPPPMKIPAGMPGTPDVITLERHREAFRREAERMHIMFDDMVRGKSFTAEWRVDAGEARSDVDALVAHGRLADLVITANANRLPDGGRSFHTAERLISEAGRPVILVPKGVTPYHDESRILIAWNGSREASRAVFDALPLLKSAQHVKVLHIETGTPSGLSISSCAAISATLRRHGVRSIYEELSLPRAAAGAALLSAAKAENANLLVMGGYGHWRFRELVLGGATRHILRHMTVPVLMSH